METALPRSGIMSVEDGWIDYNGHMNMAYYNVLFDRAVDGLLLGLGFGPDYIESHGASWFIGEVHVRYLRELLAGTQVVVTSQILDVTPRAMHLFQELRHAQDGWLSATCEQSLLHVDMKRRKVCTLPQDRAARLNAFAAPHLRLPKPAGAGRSVTLARGKTA